MDDAAHIQALIREGDEAFQRLDGRAAIRAWTEALNKAPIRLRSQIICRLGFRVSPRAQKMLKLMHAIEEAFPGEMPFVSDGMAVWHKLNPFMADAKYLNTATEHATLLPLANWHWNLGTVAWAVQQVKTVPGDFVELGVFKGHTTAFVAQYLDFANWDRKWWLYDTFSGVPDDQLDGGWSDRNANLYDGTFSLDEVRQRFAAYPNIEVIQGRVPEVLSEKCPERIAFLHMDLNNSTAEIAALEFLFDRISPGGVIVFDDYGWVTSHAQHHAEKAWFKERGLVIMELPTGQGVFVKPARV